MNSIFQYLYILVHIPGFLRKRIYTSVPTTSKVSRTEHRLKMMGVSCQDILQLQDALNCQEEDTTWTRPQYKDKVAHHQIIAIIEQHGTGMFHTTCSCLSTIYTSLSEKNPEHEPTIICHTEQLCSLSTFLWKTEVTLPCFISVTDQTHKKALMQLQESLFSK